MKIEKANLLAAVVMLALAFSPTHRAGRTFARHSTSGASGSPHAITEDAPRARAPELVGGRGWLNTDRPLSLAALKGKFVLLDFWTYGCINCMHVIPELKRLESKYEHQLVIIGVHSGKFDNEKETENIRRVIVRYGIEHPVINDADFAVWRAYKTDMWPSWVLIDPAGYIIGRTTGENQFGAVDAELTRAVAEARRRGELNEEPLKLALERAKVGDQPLAFPGKVLADAKSGRLYISDSSHNRIVVTDLDGALVETIGTGEAGAQDGPFGAASFFRPQGLALEGDALYVADTENHLVRRVDTKARTVETIAGTGRQARVRSRAGPARAVDISSPWDLQLVGRSLYIAMAGLHQIWRLDLDKSRVELFAGSGVEGRRDGPLLEASFAQPSGLAYDGTMLYTADSEANVIRAIDPGAGQVRTLVGADLFQFGDVEGSGGDVRLQHPLGVLALGDKILIADTYNHKIKELDPRRRTVRTLLGTGDRGQKDARSPSFYEPAGLSHADGRLYVADTNNHAVRVVDLKTKATSTLNIRGLGPPAASATPRPQDGDGPNVEEVKVAPQRLRADGDGLLQVGVELPAGYHLNPAAPQRFKASVESGTTSLTLDAQTAARSGKDVQLPLRIPLRTGAVGSAELRVRLTLYYCREDNTGTCYVKTLTFRAPVEIKDAEDAPSEVKLRGKLDAR